MIAGDKRFKTYDDILWYVEQPLAERRWLRIGRHGKYVVPRRFHLTKERIVILRRQYRKEKRMPNPFNRGFSYYLFEALIELGINKPHPMAAVVQKAQDLMSDPMTVQLWNGTTAWSRWTSTARGERTLINDWQARFEMNVVVLQRLTGFTPYGRKLMDVGKHVMGGKGMVIDVLLSESGERQIRLNARSDRPRNDTKQRGLDVSRKKAPAQPPCAKTLV